MFVVWMVYYIICMTLVVVPVTVQALGITSTTGNVVVYNLSVLALLLVTSILSPGRSTQLVLVMAYAAVVGNSTVRG